MDSQLNCLSLEARAVAFNEKGKYKKCFESRNVFMCCGELTVNSCTRWPKQAGRQMCVQMCVFPHLSVSQSLVVDLVQDDHTIRGDRFLPRDMHWVFCHLVIDRTPDVVSFVCRGQSHMLSQITSLYFLYSVLCRFLAFFAFVWWTLLSKVAWNCIVPSKFWQNFNFLLK